MFFSRFLKVLVWNKIFWLSHRRQSTEPLNYVTKNVFSFSLPVLYCFSIVSSLLSFVCFCSLFPISFLFFLPSYRDVSSRLDCFLLILLLGWYLSELCIQKSKQANLLCLGTLLDTTLTSILCVRVRKGKLKLFGVCWRSEGQRGVFFFLIYLLEIST